MKCGKCIHWKAEDAKDFNNNWGTCDIAELLCEGTDECPKGLARLIIEFEEIRKELKSANKGWDAAKNQH